MPAFGGEDVITEFLGKCLYSAVIRLVVAHYCSKGLLTQGDRVMISVAGEAEEK